MDSQRKQAEAAAMKSREYQITLTDGKRTGIATLRLDGVCVEMMAVSDNDLALIMEEPFWRADATIAHVRDIPDESEGAADGLVKLQRDIHNLQTRTPDELLEDHRLREAYQRGARDARHRACDIVLEHYRKDGAQ